MSENRVVIYSNGIADFQRCYQISAAIPHKIAIPVRQDHLADVLASFNVYGEVKLDAPPTFRPSNELAGNVTIDPHRVLEDIATTLSGARVCIDTLAGNFTGTLVGLHQEEEATTGEPIHPKSIIVLSEGGLRHCRLRDIQSFRFTDQDVQAEINKALQRNYQRIKPNSTFVELVLSTQAEKTDAVVQYTIPAAAWKISYRLCLYEEGETELHGYAVVDNNTDEDWNDFRVCVVTGEPITFSTDLAESKSPQRKHVDLVPDTALGAVEVESAIPALMPEATLSMHKASSARMQVTSDALEMPMAEMTDTDVHEVGDFNFFESTTTVTIPAKRSTVIPVFQVAVADCKSVLHYKHEDHPDRPYRTVDFTNHSGFSLGRGVCTVFEAGAYAGNCLIPALKPQEAHLLPHALETGVSVRREQKRQRNQLVGLRLAEGFCYTSRRERRETHYHLQNSRDQTFQLFLDHQWNIPEPESEASCCQNGETIQLTATAELARGERYSVALEPHARLTIKIVEQRIAVSQIELVDAGKQNLRIDWLVQNIVRTNGPLALDAGIQKCLEIQQQLATKHQDILAAEERVERLAQRQDRLRKNIQSGGQDELSNRWRSELDEAEQAIRELEEEQLPALRHQEQTLREQLAENLRSLSAEWSEAST